MKKCALYGRVSTPGQRGDNQLYDLRLYAQQSGFEVVAEYADLGVAGSKSRRPGLDAMLKDARNGRFNAVIVAGFDHLARSTKHLISVVRELDDLGVVFVSMRENIATDTATGRQFLDVISSLATMESDIIKERIRAGMRRRRQDGFHVGRRPLEVDRNALVRDRLMGMSLTDVAKRYGCSRASVVRWVREARQITSMPIAGVSASRPLVEEYAA
jgi:DNA invertase Pin-like site-specific DNA recombinase